MTLREYLDKNEISIYRMAQVLGITRTHLSNIANEKYLPGKSLARLINMATYGAVTIQTKERKKKVLKNIDNILKL